MTTKILRPCDHPDLQPSVLLWDLYQPHKAPYRFQATSPKAARDWQADVPGLWQFGEMYDLIGLIAPRPVLIEAATRDWIFPVDAVRLAISRGRLVYEAFGTPDALETDIFEGRHEINGRKSYDFLLSKLTM